MASSGYSPVRFLRTFENAFYFQEETTEDKDFESDSFQATEKPSKNCWVQSKDNKSLLYNQEHFEAQHLDQSQLSQPDCHFKLKTFSEHPRSGKGVAAMLYVTINGENNVVCCKEKHKIYPETMVIPEKIEGNNSKAIFYMTQLPSSKSFVFESSECQGYCLGFVGAESDPNLIQLALIQNGPSEVVDACVVKLEDI